MRLMKISVPLLVSLLLGACGNSSVCEKPKLYQQSQPGKRVEAPEGLDPLQPEREMTIPDVSPRPQPQGPRCLELPPTFGSDED
jgi:uncharacterized lipoprotein